MTQLLCSAARRGGTITLLPIGSAEDCDNARRVVSGKDGAGTVLFQGVTADPEDPLAEWAVCEFEPEVIVSTLLPGYWLGVKTAA